jgi:hypothetical protein
MVIDTEKRHSTAGIDSESHGQEQGVGGRQEEAPLSPGGGGYQKKCEFFNFSDHLAKNRDPRLDELREMGVQRSWLEVAEAIGVDNFLKVWRILDADATNKTEDGRRLVPMRSYSCFERFQRNRYIESLVDLGLSTTEIRSRLIQQIGEKVSARHILRFRRKG